jgi:hypothetical protein
MLFTVTKIAYVAAVNDTYLALYAAVKVSIHIDLLGAAISRA